MRRGSYSALKGFRRCGCLACLDCLDCLKSGGTRSVGSKVGYVSCPAWDSVKSWQHPLVAKLVPPGNQSRLLMYTISVH